MIKSRAAVAFEAKKPLEIVEVDVAMPKAGEVLLRVVASGVCHTDAYTLSGADPEGIFPSILGHEGGAVVEAIGEGVTSVAVGDHVIPLYTPECGKCKFCLSQDQPLPGHSCHPGQRPDAGRHYALFLQGPADFPLHGHLDLFRIHRAARNFRGQDP